jgi:two-component system, NarL family, sensor kinase
VADLASPASTALFTDQEAQDHYNGQEISLTQLVARHHASCGRGVDDRDMRERGGRAVLAPMLFAVASAEVLIAIAAGIASDRGWTFLLNHFVVTNAVIGGSLALAGWPIAWQRPRNPIGWLLLAGGVCYAGSAAAFSLLAWGSHAGDERPFWRLIATWANLSWPWAITFCVPMTLLLFPTGQFLSRRWYWTVPAAALNAILFAATGILSSENLAADLGVTAYFVWPRFETFVWLEPVAEVLGDIVYGAAALSLILRYVRGDDRVRRQMLWLLLAVAIVLLGWTVPGWLGIQTPASLFAIALIPIAIMIAVLRYQLLDIRLVVSRFALYLLLSAFVIAGYLGLVTLLDRALAGSRTAEESAVVVLLLAVIFNPVRVWLQRRIDRLFYGSRQDPARAVAEVGSRLGEHASGSTGLEGALAALCETLRIPAAAIQVNGIVLAKIGELSGEPYVAPLRRGTTVVGELLVNPRLGERKLPKADQHIVALLADLLAVAVQTTQLADELVASRADLIAAREDERQRLRQNLHDGLGPALTGVMLKAAAARRLATTEPANSAVLLRELERNVAAAIADVRGLVDELRPPVLDGRGLVGALQDYVDSVQTPSGPRLQLSTDGVADLGQLAESVEVAAYRIATESLTNVLRHAHAESASIALWVDDNHQLQMKITDDGVVRTPWIAGVGLSSMRDRAAALGGRISAGPGASGGEVRVTLPLAVS